MKKFILNIFIIVIVMISMSCGKNLEKQMSNEESSDLLDNNNEESNGGDDVMMPDPIIFDYETEYQIEEFATENTNIGLPMGICEFGDNILVCDKKNNCLVELDSVGNYVKTIGKLGMGPKEFTEPTGIISYNDKIYVLDAGNNRIQILDSSLEFVEEIKLNTLIEHQAGVRYVDIAIDSVGQVYLSTDAVGIPDADIYLVREGNITKLNRKFSGYLTSYEGTIYAMDKCELYIKGNVSGMTAGNNFLYKIVDENVEQISKFPYMYSPMDFCIKGEKIYTISCIWGQFNCVDMNGNIESAIIDIQTQGGDMYILPSGDGTFWVSDVKKKVMYRITK